MALENRRRPSINEFLIIFEWRRAAGEWSFISGAVIGGRCDNDYPPSRNFFVTANSPPLLSVIIDWVSARIIWSFFCFFHKNSICCLPRNLQTNPNEYLSCPICCDYRYNHLRFLYRTFLYLSFPVFYVQAKVIIRREPSLYARNSDNRWP